MKPRSRTSRFRSRSLFRVLTLGAVALAAALVATNLTLRGVSPDLVISQVYGGGGNTGAPYRNDFVEIFNRGSAAVSLTGKSVQYASATGTGNFGANPVTALSGTLQPGQYYLVQLTGGANGVALPTPDATGTVNMSGSAGKVALVNSTTGLACNGGSTVCSSAQLALIVDLVGYGNANFYEGAGSAATLSNTTAAFRAGGGCQDTDANSADFATAAPAPRNTASSYLYCSGPTDPSGNGVALPASVDAGAGSLLTVTVIPGANPPSTGIAVAADLSPLGLASTQVFYDDGTNGDVTAGDAVFSFVVTVPSSAAGGRKSLPFTVSDAQSRSGEGSIALTVIPPPMPIHDIQGPGVRSPYVSQFVTTLGVVTARRANNGFFIQAPDNDVDLESNTSEGIFVFTGGAPPADAAVGNYVRVSGTVEEYVADPYAPSMTEIASQLVVVLGAGQPLPQAVPLTAANLLPTGGFEQLEQLEGMRVSVAAMTTVSPTGGTFFEASGTSTSNGVFYAVIEDTPRPFREPGVEVPDEGLPAGAPPDVPHFDLNPERLRIDSDGQVGAAKLEVTSGVVLENVTGVLDFGYRTWTILPDPGSLPAAVDGGRATPVPMPGANEFTVASFNMQRFVGTVSAAEFAKRLNKSSLAIRGVLQTPDVLGVQEIDSLATLQTLAAKVNADAVAAGQPDPGYAAYLEEGNDPGGIDVGLLVRTERVTNITVVQEGKDATYLNPSSGNLELLNDRPPLVLTAEVHGMGVAVPVTVIVNHLRSLSGIDDPVAGPRVRAKRLAQAEFLADLIQARQVADPGERIISVGDYNAFEVNDGYVDVIGSVRGAPAPFDQVVLAGTDLVDPDLTDLTALVPPADRYSYSFGGNAQLLDHIIVNGSAQRRFSRVHFARSNADFPESYRSDGDRPERLSDHDMPVAYFLFRLPPVVSDVTPSMSYLWPPNHQLETVNLRYSVAGDGGPYACSVGVASNEPVNGTGDGDTYPDWVLSTDTSVRLRAERAGTGSGRVYTLTVTCQDAFGYWAAKNTTVTVPKSMGNGRK